jgi:hypothetical protein
MPYTNPRGGSRLPTPRPAAPVGRIPMSSWRQPVGGLRSTAAPAAGLRGRPG